MLSLLELGKIADVSIVVIKKIENHSHYRPSINTVAKIAAALGVSLEYLIERREE